jgi:hypothetical protein
MDVNDILKKYSKKIDEQVGTYNLQLNSIKESYSQNVSRDYLKFKKDMMPELSRYEKITKSFGNFIKLKLSAKDKAKIQKDLAIAHLDLDPSLVGGLSIIGFLAVFVIGILISLAVFLIYGNFPILLLFLSFVSSLFVYYYLNIIPSRLATKWKLKASSQMVPAILYTVIYMKHTSNLERAIGFVSEHIEAPLSLDLKKVLWDVETGRFSSIKESLDSYLSFWKESNIEFVESFHLIESSLYEPSEDRRVQILERALKVILDGIYEAMLKYTHTIKSPLTNIYMLGIVLPTLALALLPLASTLLGGSIQWIHVFLIFNLIIPFFVFYLTSQVLLKRPGGYGETSLLERNPLYYQYESKEPYYKAFLISFPLLLLGLMPLIIGYTPLMSFLGIVSPGEIFDPQLSAIGLGFLGSGTLFGFEKTALGIVGPFGVFSLLLSLLIPLSISLFFSISLSFKTKQLIRARNETKELENEFNSSLFTLGNRLGDGTPAEIAFLKVAESSIGQKTENFFRIVNNNIQSMGMGLEDAMFNPKRGALVYYPSSLIATSMKILIESVKKGLKVAAESLMSISEYVKNLQKINQRLADLLADVVSDMKSNMTFLAPLLAGIIIGLSSMITSILSQLKNLAVVQGDSSLLGFTSISNITQLFDIANMIPPYFMQVAIGVYIIQIIFILTATLVTIDSGEDRLKQSYDISKNLLSGGILYLITALISIIALSALANIALIGLRG